MGKVRNKVESERTKELIKEGKKKFVRYEEGAVFYSIGINTFRKIAQDAGAIYRLGGRIVLVNTEIVDDYLEHFRDEY